MKTRVQFFIYALLCWGMLYMFAYNWGYYNERGRMKALRTPDHRINRGELMS